MAVPFHYTARHVPRLGSLIGMATGILSIVVGAVVIAHSLPEAF
jgi:hypothetical protein